MAYLRGQHDDETNEWQAPGNEVVPVMHFLDERCGVLQHDKLNMDTVMICQVKKKPPRRGKEGQPQRLLP